MPSSENRRIVENRLVRAASIVVFLLILAGFAGILLKPRNTLALIEPVLRLLRPSASSADIDRLHITARDLGHFLIPAAAFGILVFGPLRRRPVLALALCVLFAVIDESIQNFIPGRSGSVADVIIDASGAVFAYFAYVAIIRIRKPRRDSAHGRVNNPAAHQTQTQTQHP